MHNLGKFLYIFVMCYIALASFSEYPLISIFVIVALLLSFK
jgi:hypothetical protein